MFQRKYRNKVRYSQQYSSPMLNPYNIYGNMGQNQGMPYEQQYSQGAFQSQQYPYYQQPTQYNNYPQQQNQFNQYQQMQQPYSNYQQAPQNTYSSPYYESLFQNPLQPLEDSYYQKDNQGPMGYANPYPKPGMMPKQPSGMGSILNSFKGQDGSLDFNKMMNTAGSMMNAMSQVSSMVKGFGSFFKP